MSYPPPSTSENGITPSCRFALWLAEYAFNGDKIGDTDRPWTFAEIYSTPLSNPANPNQSLLHRIHANLNAAASGGIISTATRDGLTADIDLFIRGGMAGPIDATNITLNSMLSDGTRDDSSAPDSTTLGGLLHFARQRGLYFPNSHTKVGDHNAISLILQDNSNRPGLWNIVGTVKNGPTRKFGSFTMRELFETALKDLSLDLFWAVRIAKRYGIIWPHPSQTSIGIPPPPGVAGEKEADPKLLVPFFGADNGKCCRLGECVPANPSSYCGTVSTADSNCNSVSDPCT